jgi:hypothetical protein
VADAVNDLFTAKFLQIVGGVARAVLLAMTGPSYTVKNIEAIAEGSDMRARLYTLVPGDVIPWDRRIPRRQQHQERRLRALQVKHHFVVAVGGDVRDILVPGLAWIGCRTQHRKLSRPGGDPDRSDEGNLDRRRTRNGRNGELVSQGHPQRLPNRRQRHRSGVDDPDQQFFENYGCRSARNYTGYCNPELEKLFDQQSALVDQSERKKLVWEIDKKLQEDVARPIVYHTRLATCMQPAVKGVTIMVNSQFNGWRLEDAWLDH